MEGTGACLEPEPSPRGQLWSTLRASLRDGLATWGTCFPGFHIQRLKYVRAFCTQLKENSGTPFKSFQTQVSSRGDTIPVWHGGR